VLTAGLGSQALLFGIVGLWLLALVPAAIVTALKGEWLMFAAGWLTLGLVWFIAAASLAPPDSWWAKNLYGEGKLMRAADPIRHPRPRSTEVIGITGFVVSIIVLGFFAARPAPLLGVDGETLQTSVGGNLFPVQPCEKVTDDTWQCAKYDDQFSGTVGYRVDVHGLGCWSGTRVTGAGEGSSKHLTGCITILDY
jgi:hypothetical protein